MDLLEQFKHKANRPGKSVVNKFETVISEVVRYKYDSNITLDFTNCLAAEKNKLRSAYTRIETKMRKNLQQRKKLSHNLPGDNALISSEEYKTLIFINQQSDER